MFKNIRKAFGGKPKKKKQPEPKLAAGEGIRRFAAALPESDSPRPAPAATPTSSNPAPAAERSAKPSEPPETARPADQSATDRKRLIDEALRIQREKAKDLDNIPSKDQARLRNLAEKMMLGEEPGYDPKSPSGKSRRRTRH